MNRNYHQSVYLNTIFLLLIFIFTAATVLRPQKERSETEYKDLMNRLTRIEGQVRGVEGMLENNAYCTDILMQVSAITSALNSFNKALLANHMKTCVADGIRNGDESVIDEFVVTLKKLMK